MLLLLLKFGSKSTHLRKSRNRNGAKLGIGNVNTYYTSVQPSILVLLTQNCRSKPFNEGKTLVREGFFLIDEAFSFAHEGQNLISKVFPSSHEGFSFVSEGLSFARQGFSFVDEGPDLVSEG